MDRLGQRLAAFGSLTAFGGPEMAFGAVWRPLAVPGR